jgi:hypothetical protein
LVCDGVACFGIWQSLNNADDDDRKINQSFFQYLRCHDKPIKIQNSSIINHQSSIINHQSSIINHQSSIINRQSVLGTRPNPQAAFALAIERRVIL